MMLNETNMKLCEVKSCSQIGKISKLEMHNLQIQWIKGNRAANSGFLHENCKAVSCFVKLPNF